MKTSIVTDAILKKARTGFYGDNGGTIQGAIEAVADDLVSAEREAIVQICETYLHEESDETDTLAKVASYSNSTVKIIIAAIKARRT